MLKKFDVTKIGKKEEEEISGFFKIYQGPTGPIGPRGPEGPQGEKGDSRTNKEIQELIKPLIPDPLPGKNGESYILTQNDKKEIASSIKVPVVEKIIEKKETPIIKEKAVKDTPNETRDKLESLKEGEKLSIQAIEDLADILEELKKEKRGKIAGPLGLLKGSVHARRGQEIRFIDDETPSGTVNGVNTDFILAKTPLAGSVKVYRGGGRQRIAEDYTLNDKTITFLIAPQVGEIILVDYRW